MKIIITENQKNKIRNFITKKIREKYDVGIDGMNGLPSYFNKSDDSYTPIGTVIEDMKETYGCNLWKLIGDVALDILEDKENYDFDEILIENISPKLRDKLLEKLIGNFVNIKKYNDYYIYNEMRYDKDQLVYIILKYFIDLMGSPKDIPEFKERREIIRNYLNSLPFSGTVNEEISDKLKNKILNKIKHKFNSIKHNGTYYEFENIGYFRYEIANHIYSYISDLIGHQNQLSDRHVIRKLVNNFLNSITPQINEQHSFKSKDKILNKIKEKFQKKKFKTDSGTINYRVINLANGDSMFPYEFRNYLMDVIGDIYYTNIIYDDFFS